MDEKKLAGQETPDVAPEPPELTGPPGPPEPNAPAEPGKRAAPPKERQAKAKKEEKEKSALRALVFLLLKLAVVAAIGWAALTYVFGVFRLAGNNMYPMLKDGDLCVTYRLEEYHSSDVVAYRVNGQIRFGRIIARSGDTVDADALGVLVNGSHPSEEIFYPTDMLSAALTLPVTLGEGRFVVLNDYREDLSDSRTYGVIGEDDLEGKVIFIFRRRGF